MKSDFLVAVTQLAAERNLPRETVVSAIEAALASAYRKDSLTAGQNITVRLNPNTGEVRVFTLHAIVEKVEDPRQQMSLAEARKLNPKAQLETTVEIEATPRLAGRIAAQTAKQVVLQRLREAERELVFEEYSGRSQEVVTGTIQRMEPRQIIVDLGRTEAVLPEREQVLTERYRPGQRLKFYISEVRRSLKGPEIVVSRTHVDLLRRLLEVEVPEVFNGIVEVKAIAREPGSRSKVAVWARQEGVDAVGACVGLRGIRIQNIVNELQGEKIDIVQWNRDPAVFVANALSPSPVHRVNLDEEQRTASVTVPDKQLSLAIGREGQNARLAAKLTGWKIDIKSSGEMEAERLRLLPARPVAASAGPEAPSAEVREVAPEAVAQVSAKEEEVPELAPAEPVPALAAADELAPAPAAAEAAPKESEGIPITEAVWQLPQITQKPGVPQIRFAEEILPSRGGEDQARRGRRGKPGAAESKKAKRAGPRSPRRTEEAPEEEITA
ncbi:MAG: transcription termination/antitermination protein NusA [Chloroflexi bacterium]|nr:transcription termination/antitermination protein NusA [Chloroflexota bacterium]